MCPLVVAQRLASDTEEPKPRVIAGRHRVEPSPCNEEHVRQAVRGVVGLSDPSRKVGEDVLMVSSKMRQNRSSRSLTASYPRRRIGVGTGA